MVTTIPKPADRTEWLRERHGFFNASQAGALYSCHPHITLADVVAEKLAPEPVDNGQTEAMERGDRLEPFLLEWWGDRHGVQVEQSQVLYVGGRLMATLDGEPVGDSETWIEAKTTSMCWDEVPQHVYWQVAAQAAASGKKGECWVVWIDSDMRYKEARVRPVPEHVADVLTRAEQFMAFIDLGMAPEGVELSGDHVARMFPAPEVGKWVDLDDVGRRMVDAWDNARRHRIEAEKHEKALRDEVMRLLADAEGGKYQGLPIVTWRNNKSSQRFSAKAHAKAAPDCHAAYTVTTPGPRVLRATKELTTFGGPS